MKFALLSAALAVASVSAQRPNGTSICDYYTTALFTNNTAENQYALLVRVVNTAVIGNYTTPNVGVAVNGILNPGTYMNQSVNLLPYFDGTLASTNNNGSSGVSVNFLDGGGAAPLMNNTPADTTLSNQYLLLEHLYQFFGVLLGCSTYGTSSNGSLPNTLEKYGGNPSMFEVHKFMVLDPYQNGYFIEQVGLAAASFGVAASDVSAVGDALAMYFNVRCSPPTTIVPSAGPQLQEICADSTCSYGANGDEYCHDYPAPVAAPTTAGTSGAASGMMSGMMSTAAASMASMASMASDSMMMSAAPTSTAVSMS